MITQARYGLLLIWILLINFGVYAFRRSRSPSLGRLAVTSLIWLLLIWGLAEAPLGVLSTKLQSISPRPRFQPAVHEVDTWLRSHGRNAPLYIGPLKGEYEPWMSSFDLWYPVDEVRSIQSLEELRALIRGSDSVGYWVADNEWLREQQLDPAELETIKKLYPCFGNGGFSVYGWSAYSGPSRSLMPDEGNHNSETRRWVVSGMVFTDFGQDDHSSVDRFCPLGPVQEGPAVGRG